MRTSDLQTPLATSLPLTRIAMSGFVRLAMILPETGSQAVAVYSMTRALFSSQNSNRRDLRMMRQCGSARPGIAMPPQRGRPEAGHDTLSS